MKKFTEWLHAADENTYEWLAEGFFSWGKQEPKRNPLPMGKPAPAPSTPNLDQFQYPPYNVDQHLLQQVELAMRGKGSLDAVIQQIASTRGFQVAQMVKRFAQGDSSGASRMQSQGAADWASGNSR